LLLVNDSPFLLTGYELQFESSFEVILAENGLQAFHIVSAELVDSFDLIILDINMPIMDGYEASIEINNFY
jgi:CheY-like chemotaxis protein